MTPEEYDRLKQVEKEHLKKLKELKQALRVLERQQRIQSTLENMSRESADALDAQEEMVERLAMETALQEARLDVSMDSAGAQRGEPDGVLEEELKRERARALVEQMKASLGSSTDDAATRIPELAPTTGSRRAESTTNADSRRAESAREGGGNPTKDRSSRPEKTIGRM